MKRITAIAIVAAALIGTSYVGNVGAATRVTVEADLYNCTNVNETVSFRAAQIADTGFFWIHVQGQNFAMSFDHGVVASFGGNPGITANQDGVDVTAVIRDNGQSLDMTYGNKPMFKCDYVERQSIVNWIR